MTLTKERRVQMVQGWLREHHVKLKPGDAVVMSENGDIGPMPQQRVQEILAEDPEHFGAMAEGARKKPGDPGIAPNAVFVLILSRNDGWSGWAAPNAPATATGS